MAWSGDIFWLTQDEPDVTFYVPEEGGVLWATPMEIPRGAAHPRDAHAFMDYVYDPEVAADITSWVGYITPVPEVQDVLLDRAKSAKDPSFLKSLASSPYVFPTEEMKAKVHSYKVLSEEEETAYNELFSEVVQG
jgi:spermidine/putrescine transport system substrate-binding protein